MSSSQNKRPTKRRAAIEQKVLHKAKKHVKLHLADEEEKEEPLDLKELSLPTINVDLKPRIKLRKPRWDKSGPHNNSNSRTTTESVQRKSNNNAESSLEKLKSKSKKKNNKKSKKNKRKSDQVADPEVGRKHEHEALEFLNKWSTDRDEWKFEKLKQVWLLKNALNPVAINDENFQLLVNYVGSVQGHARKQLEQEMQKVVQNFEEDISKRLMTKPSTEDTDKYERARQIIQMMNDD